MLYNTINIGNVVCDYISQMPHIAVYIVYKYRDLYKVIYNVIV